MVKPSSPAGNKSRRKTKQTYHTLVLLGIGVLLALIATLFRPLTATNFWLTDQLFPSKPPSTNIVMVGIDDITLDTYGRLSDWPRQRHADAIDNLSAAGAKVIGFDVLFVDDSPDDAALAASMKNAGNVVLPVAGSGVVNGGATGPSYQSFLVPAGPLADAAHAAGHVNVSADHDGKVRRVPLMARDAAGNEYPSFGLAVLDTLFSVPPPQQFRIQDNRLHALSRDIPVDGAYRLRINFGIDSGKLSYLSYKDVISGNFPKSVVKNKVVLIGMMSTGDIDAWSIPTSDSKVPGVLIHAAAIQTILKQDFLRDANSTTTLEILILLTLIVALALPRVRLQLGLGLVVFLFLGNIAVIMYSFDKGFILNVLYPSLLLMVLMVASVVCVIVIEQADKRMVRDLFGRYVSPDVAKEILTLADADRLTLGGETREVTALFADVRGFTTMSERMSPEEIVSVLNSHFSIIIDKVLEHGGMVNKFAGDNIMAVWNAPRGQHDHARLAIKAAWEAQHAMAALPGKTAEAPGVQFGIGINTGKALAGNIGSQGRSEYTIIGDTVNLASRICSGTPGGEVWVGPETYQQAKERVKVEEMGPKTFKGKSDEVFVYRVLGCD